MAAGANNTELHGSRKLTKTIKGYTGTRTWIGPVNTFTSDLPILGEAWPSDDYVYSNWNGVNTCYLQKITLEHHFQQDWAKATAEYGKSANGGVDGAVESDQEGKPKIATLALTYNTIELDQSPQELADLKYYYRDLSTTPKRILADPAKKLVPTMVLNLTCWTDTEPVLSDARALVGYVNSDKFFGASPSWWMCTGCNINKNDPSTWEVSMEFSMATLKHWNETVWIPKTDPIEYYRTYDTVNFSSKINGITGYTTAQLKTRWKFSQPSTDER